MATISSMTQTRKKAMSNEHRQEPDGTWTVDFSWAGSTRIIRGIPTLELAREINEALWEAYHAGADSYASSQF